MTIRTADRLHVVAAWLNTLPLPEPYVASVDSKNAPHVSWHVLDYEALAVIAALGGTWSVHTYDDPQTIATRDVDHLGTRICVTVAVAGVNLPDLATDALGVAP